MSASAYGVNARELTSDLKRSVLSLRRTPVLTAVVIATLGLTLGASAAVFSLVDNVLLAPLPYPDADRLISVYGAEEGPANRTFNGYLPVSWSDFEDLRDQASLLDGAYAHGSWPVGLGGTGTAPAVRITANYVSARYFELLGVSAHLGSVLARQHSIEAGDTPVAVVSHTLWQQRFGGDPSVIGSTIRINDHPVTLIGVTPPGFSGTSATLPNDVWLPANMFESTQARFGPLMRERGVRIFFVTARMRPGVTLEQAAIELDEIGGRLAARHPASNADRSFRAIPLSHATVNPGLRPLYLRAAGLATGGVVVILLVALLNVANLLFVRALGRAKEIAIRATLGAAPGDVTRLFLLESFVLFSAGGVAAVAVAVYAHMGLAALQPPTVLQSIQSFEPELSLRALGAIVALSGVGCLLFGLLPASLAARRPLRHSSSLSSRSVTPDRSTARKAFVVAQVSLSVIALVFSGLLLRSLDEARKLDQGWEPDSLGMVSFDPGASQYDETKRRLFFRSVVGRVSRLAGVSSAAVAQLRPLTPGPLATVRPDEPPADGTDGGTAARLDAVSDSYFETLGVRVASGRTFDERDSSDGAPVAIVNEVLARRFWPGVDPVGRSIHLGDGPALTVVGVAGVSRYVSVGEEPQSALYLPLEQAPPTSGVLFARFDQGAQLDVDRVRAAVQSVDPALPVYGVAPASDLVADALWSARIGAILMFLLGMTALTLSCLGVYGVVATSVRQRSGEMGIRMALGADGGTVFREVMLTSTPLLVIGLGIGVPIALGVTTIVDGLLYSVDPWDARTFGAVILALSVVGLCAAAFPAARAARSDPVSALRGA